MRWRLWFSLGSFDRWGESRRSRKTVMTEHRASTKLASLVESLLHNIGVVAVGFGVALLGVALDSRFGLRGFKSLAATVPGSLLLAIGFLLRVWATYLFYGR